MALFSKNWEISPPRLLESCPCRRPFRLLQDEEGYELWQMVFTSVVLIVMFAVLITDRVGVDWVMLTALTTFMASGIISLDEGLGGFSNEGLLTVLTLFVVADGISKTGALDWYMGKLLGRPKTAASAQLRMMVPVAMVSAFLNNTPVVAVMLPIVQKWAKNNKIPIQQLLIHLSYATILGGTCTLIGTSTNLVVAGLLSERYPDDPNVKVGLFDIGLYGVPLAVGGIAYMIAASPHLLPGGDRRRGLQGNVPPNDQEDILLGARVASWSPAAGRSVKRSGLRDTGGIYLVSVYRAATGNVHRAVGQDFVLNVGDVLYFTGLIEGFGEFCNEHGLEMLVSESDNKDEATITLIASASIDEVSQDLSDATSPSENQDEMPVEIGITKQSLFRASDAERSRALTRMIGTC